MQYVLCSFQIEPIEPSRFMHYLLHHKFSDTSLLQIGQGPENQFTFQPIIFEGKTYFRREA